MVKHSIQAKDIDGVSLIGFRINPDSESPDVYTLMTYGAIEAPIVYDGQILFFRSPALAIVAFNFFDEGIKKLASPPTDIEAVCDIAATLHTINHQATDESATILNCLNTIFDLVDATELTMPDEYKEMLYNFADHLTFERDFNDYIEQKGFERITIINALLWCVGAVVSRSKILTG